MKKLYFFFAAMCCMMVANAAGFKVDGINYTVTSEEKLTVEVGANTGCSGDVTIPAKVTDGGGVTYSVTGIGEEAFRCTASTSITSIAIPASVTSIGSKAFYNCKSLSSVTFVEGSKLSVIKDNAFYNCTKLSSIIIPASVTTLENLAFKNCSSLSSVTFAEGSKLSVIGDEAFRTSKLTSIVIPASVTSIGSKAFFGCSSLSSVTFANGSQLSVIKNDAFYNCTTLSSIIIPASVTTLEDCAFQSCSSLSSVTFAEGSKLNAIGANAFDRTAITSIEIPASVTSIGQYAFQNSANLASVTVHWTESLPSMGGTNPNPFYSINKDAVLNVPFGTVAMYSAVNAFKVFKEIKSPDFKLGVSSAGWASMYLPCAVTIPSGAEVYYASAVSGSTITLSKVEGTLPAETGVIVKAEEGTVEFAETAEAGTPIVGNLFEGVLADKSDYKDVYVLSGASAEGKPLFQEYEGEKLNAFKAYLPMSAVPDGGEIKFRFDEATGIESLTPALSEGEGAIYNLNGVRVDGSYRGIVIRNGKKMFNK